MKSSPVRLLPSLKRALHPGVNPGASVYRKTWIQGRFIVVSTSFYLSTAGCEYFLTRNQAEELGGTIRCKGLLVVFWKMLERENKKTGEKELTPFMRYYKVYPANGVDGLDVSSRTGEKNSSIERAEAIIQRMPNRPVINYGGNDACYIPSRDEVRVPALESFSDSADFYQTTYHELAHSTGHNSRLKRDGVTQNLSLIHISEPTRPY